MHDTRLYSIGLAVHLDNACFDSEAGFGGGVLYARFGSIITVEDSTFTGNKAENDGGVIYATSNSSITEVTWFCSFS